VTAISTQTIEAQRLAADLMQRDLALGELVGTLDPERSMSLWALAGVITRALHTHATGLARIEAGGRLPQNEIERTLLVLRHTACPTSQRRCYQLLQDLLGD
jgi:hypothetical protein